MIYLDKSTDQQAVYIPKDEYTGTPGGHTTAILQSKDWEITHNGITRVSPDAGYDGVSGGTITVYVNSDTATTFEHLTAEENGEYVAGDSMAYSAVTVDVDMETPYEEGYASGYTSGVTHQKSLLASTAITLNGRYTREDGWNEVTVNVPTGGTIHNQTKDITATTNGEMVISYDEGYTGLEQVNLTVNVPQTGGTVHNQTKYVNFTGNTATTVTFDAGYTGLESVGIIVNVPEPEFSGLTATTNGDYTPSGFDGYSAVTVDVSATTTPLTATTNGTYTVPFGYDGYGTVKVQVPTTGATTAATVQVGMTELTTPATSVTCYGYATPVTGWTQLSAETAVTIDKWMMLDFEGYNNNTEVSTYPTYKTNETSGLLPYMSTFEQQLPYVNFGMSGFFQNSLPIQHIKIYDLGVLGTRNGLLDNQNMCWANPNIVDVTIENKGFAGYNVPTEFFRAFAGCPSLTSVTITQEFNNSDAIEMFVGSTALTYVNLSGLTCQSAGNCEGIFSGCISLETIEGFTGAIDYDSIDDTTNPFYNLPALANFSGFYLIGVNFSSNPTAEHTVDLSNSTALTHTSLVNLINNLGTVDSSVTNAKLILGATNLAKLTPAEQAMVINKNWQLS